MTTSKKLSVVAKSCLAVGAVSAVATNNLDADVILIDDRPVSLEVAYDSNRSDWDIDGDGSVDMALANIPALGFSYTSGGGYFIPLNGALADYNGDADVLGSSPHGVVALQNGFSIGPTGNGYQWNQAGYVFGLGARAYGYYPTNPYSYSFQITGYGGTEILFDFENFEFDDNLFGFRFDIGGNLHYGWAELNLDGRMMTLTRWAYESDPNTAIRVGIPEPSSLAILGLGAAGLLAYRGRRREEECSTADNKA